MIEIINNNAKYLTQYTVALAGKIIITFKPNLDY